MDTDYMFTYTVAEDDEGDFIIIDNEGTVTAQTNSLNLACVIAASLHGMAWTIFSDGAIEVWPE